MRGQSSSQISHRSGKKGDFVNKILKQTPNLRSSVKAKNAKNTQEEVEKMNLTNYNVLKEFA